MRVPVRSRSTNTGNTQTVRTRQRDYTKTFTDNTSCIASLVQSHILPAFRHVLSARIDAHVELLTATATAIGSRWRKSCPGGNPFIGLVTSRVHAVDVEGHVGGVRSTRRWGWLFTSTSSAWFSRGSSLKVRKQSKEWK